MSLTPQQIRAAELIAISITSCGSGHSPQQASQPRESKPTTPASAKPQEVIDWAGMPNTELWATKVKGASDEKIRRSYEAICLYNDTIATGDNDRLAITNQALREFSGVNGLLVTEPYWLANEVSG